MADEPCMTVGRLLAVLQAMEPDTEVIVQTTTSTWRPVVRIERPYDGGRIESALCLVPGMWEGEV